ncbi:MAG TPA: hybrid sensor histidine kinase/response regulator [Rudaea sp.]|nr:hybrid sensor histidine kinase/response regulator [Rudaea sp.]
MASRNTPVPSGKERRAPLVMVVDDESINVQLISTLLTERGYDVLPALSGEEALERSAIRRPDLAIFDLKMPGMDGIALCRQFREIPELAAVPVIFVTGTADEEALVRCFEAGAVDFLSKPILAAELLQRVRTHLELKFSRDRLVLKARDCDTLTAMVAHDLKSPLASIRFSVQMLAEEPALREERLQDLLAALIDSTDRTLAFIEDFLNRNAAASTVSLDAFRPFALRDLLASVVQIYNQYGSEKKIRVEFPPAEPVEAFADPLAVEHVIENLLSNAIKFAPPGSRVRVVLEPGNPGTARVRVLDRGPGIDDSDRKRLFQRYVRLSARPTSGESSTGLGLSIAKQLVDAMHGSLAYEPRPGGGSVFVVELPTRPVS